MIVGYCGKCGAAIRQFEGSWNAIIPPPFHYDCSCRNVAVITTNSSSFSNSGKAELSKTITGKAELTENVIPQSEEIALLRKQLDEAQSTIAKLNRTLDRRERSISALAEELEYITEICRRAEQIAKLTMRGSEARK